MGLPLEQRFNINQYVKPLRKDLENTHTNLTPPLPSPSLPSSPFPSFPFLPKLLFKHSDSILFLAIPLLSNEMPLYSCTKHGKLFTSFPCPLWSSDPSKLFLRNALQELNYKVFFIKWTTIRTQLILEGIGFWMS